jgi:DNA-binding winged helix-turn-helix (wHTH) protein/tetratricopeptide (TPR) repeat protein
MPAMPPSAGDLYRFGEFELDPCTRTCLRKGTPLVVTPKAFEVLAYLVANPGRVVTKAELLKAVWPDSFVEESNLAQHISWLRKALGDRSDLIDTVPGRGYQFATVVQVISPSDASLPEQSAGTLVQGVREHTRVVIEESLVLPHAGRATQASTRAWPYYALVVVIVSVLAAVVWAGWKSRRSVTAAEFDKIVVADFENLTDDPVFDRSLSTALATSLDQSSVTSVYSRGRMRETLVRMEKADVGHIDETLALEIAEREGIKAVIVPTIAEVGGSYRLSARIRAVASGKDIKTEVSAAESKQKVLDAVDELAANLRRDLGDSIQKISESKPLAAATTSSLEALKQYSLGVEKRNAGQVQEAKTMFENALRIDPNFTAAMGQLGNLHVTLAGNSVPTFDAQVGRSLLSQAVLHVSSLTDRERYVILAYHAQWVENDREKAAGYYKALLAIHPGDAAAYSSLAWDYSLLGRYDESIAAAKESIRVDPRFLPGYLNLAAVQLYQLGDAKSALETCQEGLQVDSHWAFGHDCVGWALLGKGEWAQAEAALEKAVMFNPQSTLSRYRLSHAQRLQGHYEQALRALEPILKIDPSDPSPWYGMGVIYEAMGDQQKARETFERYRQEIEARWKKNPKDANTAFSLADAFARLGQFESAMSWAHKGMALDPSKHDFYADVLALNHRKHEAIEQLQLAIQNGYRWYIFIKIDPDLQSLHGEPEFEKLLAERIKT